MEAISTSAVTTVEDTSFVILTDVFVSRNRSKGASIDDRSARRLEKSSGGKKRRRKERAPHGNPERDVRVCTPLRGGFICRANRKCERGVGGARKASNSSNSSRGKKEEEKRYAPHPPRQKAGRPLFIFRPQHNILLRKAAKARHDLRAAVPLPFAIAL